jgi:nitroreductase
LGAGALVLVLGDLRATAAYPYPLPRRARSAMLEQSLAMCIQNMWLMATRLGMVATNHTMGEPTSEDRIRRHFDIPEHHVLPTMLALGYPRRPQHPRPRRALDELVHHERYDRDRLRTDEELIDAFYAQGVRGRGFR